MSRTPRAPSHSRSRAVKTSANHFRGRAPIGQRARAAKAPCAPEERQGHPTLPQETIRSRNHREHSYSHRETITVKTTPRCHARQPTDPRPTPALGGAASPLPRSRHRTHQLQRDYPNGAPTSNGRDGAPPGPRSTPALGRDASSLTPGHDTRPSGDRPW